MKFRIFGIMFVALILVGLVSLASCAGNSSTESPEIIAVEVQ